MTTRMRRSSISMTTRFPASPVTRNLAFHHALILLKIVMHFDVHAIFPSVEFSSTRVRLEHLSNPAHPMHVRAQSRTGPAVTQRKRHRGNYRTPEQRRLALPGEKHGHLARIGELLQKAFIACEPARTRKSRADRAPLRSVSSG